jgi:hypothetical protein
MTTDLTPRRSRTLGLATRTFHRFLYLASALPLAGVWIGVLAAGWALSLALVVTPLALGVQILFGMAVRFLAWVEGFLARRLLRAPAYPRRRIERQGNYWRAGIGTLRDGRFWRGQAFGWLRAVLGLLTGVVSVAMLGAGLGLLAAPAWYRFIPDDHGRNGLDFGFWKADTFGESLALVPVGLVVFGIGIGLVHLFASMWRRLAVGILGGNND